MELLDKIGKEFYEYFKNSGITKILTIEASGIAIAMATARYFKLPFVFAKKTDSQNLDREVYSESVFSYTRKLLCTYQRLRQMGLQRYSYRHHPLIPSCR